jgi:hypothetical protein
MRNGTVMSNTGSGSSAVRTQGGEIRRIYDENLFKGDSPEDLPILMLRDALRVIEKEAD